jgi:hypothetical protein
MPGIHRATGAEQIVRAWRGRVFVLGDGVRGAMDPRDKREDDMWGAAAHKPLPLRHSGEGRDDAAREATSAPRARGATRPLTSYTA